MNQNKHMFFRTMMNEAVDNYSRGTGSTVHRFNGRLTCRVGPYFGGLRLRRPLQFVWELDGTPVEYARLPTLFVTA